MDLLLYSNITKENYNMFTAFQMALVQAAIVIFLFAMVVALPFIPTFLGTTSAIIMTVTLR